MPTTKKTQNRHPVDRLADLRMQIKALQDEEKSVRDLIMQSQDYVGDENVALPKTSKQKRLDRPSLEAKFGKAEVDACCKEIAVVTLNLFKKADIVSAA